MPNYKVYHYDEAENACIASECEEVKKMIDGLKINKGQVFSSAARRMVDRSTKNGDVPKENDRQFFAKVVKRLQFYQCCRGVLGARGI